MGQIASASPRLILVSERLPVVIRRAGSERRLERTRGGMVDGLGPVHDASDSLWIGTLEAQDSRRFADQLAAERLIPVVLGAADARRHVEGMGSRVLWPLCHYLLDHVDFDQADYAAYVRTNERFAEVIAAHMRPGDLVWIHDYHLLLLPQLLRQRFPRAAIGFFLHIPFPSSEVLRILPRKEALLAGLMGANLIGVHTFDYGRHLVSSCQRVLGVEFDADWVRQSDGGCRIDVFPMGIDVAEHQRLGAGPGVRRRVDRLQRQVDGRQVILGVDRMDSTKGLPERLAGFRRLLEVAPAWREAATLWQVALPSRSSLPRHQELKAEVERRVGEINGAYQTGGLSPISYMYRNLAVEQLLALYQLAPVALITPTRDGMNLVAKEYIASRSDDSGVLVLSEFAGAAAELAEALIVNPHDPDSITQALQRALTMPRDEQGQRMAALRRRVAAHTVHDWVDRFLQALAEFQRRGRGAAAPLLPLELEVPRLVGAGAAFCAARRALVALDYDGTLMEQAATPAAAAPSPALRQQLLALAQLPGVEVLILSGRDPANLTSWLGDLPLHLIAEHGFHGRSPGPAAPWERLTPPPDLAWQAQVMPVLTRFCDRAPGAEIEQRPVSLVWHYRRTEPGFGQFLARALRQELEPLAATAGLSVLPGHRAVEVRPRGTDKGTALRHFLAHRGPFDFVLAIGDDRRDEAMFAHLGDAAWTVRVGPVDGPTQARARLTSPVQVLAWLQQLTAARLARPV